MLPRLYDYSTNLSDYQYNGYGFLNGCNSCIVTEEKNGEYTLNMEVVNSDRLIKKVVPGMVIKVKANPYDPLQLFFVDTINTNKGSNGTITTIEASHIRYAFYQNCTLGNGAFTMTGNPQEIMNEILSDSYLALKNYFTFKSDIATRKEFKLTDDCIKTIGDICSNQDGGLLELFPNGEYYFNNFEISFMLHRGRAITFPRKIYFGKNMSDFTQTLTYNNVYNRILPYAKINSVNGGTITLSTNNLIVIGNGGNMPKILKVDLTDKMQEYSVDPATGKNYDIVQNKLYDLGLEYAANNSIDSEKVSISITYQSDLEQFQSIQLCDNVRVVFGKSQATTAQITKYTYDCLREKYTSLEIGSKPLKVSDFITNKRRF